MKLEVERTESPGSPVNGDVPALRCDTLTPRGGGVKQGRPAASLRVEDFAELADQRAGGLVELEEEVAGEKVVVGEVGLELEGAADVRRGAGRAR